MWRCVSSMSTRRTSGAARCRATRRPVPASSTTREPGCALDLDAGGVAAVPHGVGSRRRLRTSGSPEGGLQSASQKIAAAPRCSPHCPCSGIAVTVSSRRAPSRPVDPHPALRGPVLLDRDRQRQLGRAESACPPHRSGVNIVDHRRTATCRSRRTGCRAAARRARCRTTGHPRRRRRRSGSTR